MGEDISRDLLALVHHYQRAEARDPALYGELGTMVRGVRAVLDHQQVKLEAITVPSSDTLVGDFDE